MDNKMTNASLLGSAKLGRAYVSLFIILLKSYRPFLRMDNMTLSLKLDFSKTFKMVKGAPLTKYLLY